MTMFKKIDKYFKLKPDSISDTNMYLGANLRYHRTNNDVCAWLLIPYKYVREDVNNCLEYLRENLEEKHSLPKKYPNYFIYNYDPDIDRLEPLDHEQDS